MTSVVAIAFTHPTSSKRDLDDLLWTKAQVAAAKSGRVPIWPPTAHDAHETDDGFIEHRALFNVKEMDR